jgi:hypothetical protein
MIDGYDPIAKLPGTGKTGITLHVNQGEQRDPLEVTVFFKKPAQGTKDTLEDAAGLTARGTVTLGLGQIGYLELFAEHTVPLDEDFVEGEG